MAYSIDPVGQGLVVSLAHPGGNTTGIDADVEQAMGKQIELLQTVVPDLTRVAVLVNSASLQAQLKNVRIVAEKARMDVLPTYVQNADDLEDVFETMSRERAVIVTVDALLFSHRQRVADLAIAKHLPSMFGTRDEVVAGGLMSYNGIFQFRQAATFVDKIIKVQSRATYRLSCQQNIGSASTSRPRRRSGLRFQNHSCCARTS